MPALATSGGGGGGTRAAAKAAAAHALRRRRRMRRLVRRPARLCPLPCCGEPGRGRRARGPAKHTAAGGDAAPQAAWLHGAGGCVLREREGCMDWPDGCLTLVIRLTAACQACQTQTVRMRTP